MFIVDSHCHLDALDYENLHKDIADVVAKAQARDVKHLLAIGVTLSRFEKAYPELAKFPNVSLACGVHPLDLEEEPYDADRYYVYPKIKSRSQLAKLVWIIITVLIIRHCSKRFLLIKSDC